MTVPLRSRGAACALTLTAGLFAGCDLGPEHLAGPSTTTTTSALGACGSTPREVPAGHSIRILSMNTQLLSSWFQVVQDPTRTVDQASEERANIIAAVLADGTYDVIGLSEAWNEPYGKDLLVPALCPVYPNYVRSVDTSTVTEERPEDAGLMVFSKLELMPLPSQAFVAEDSESSLGNNSDRIAFTRFDDCSGLDCLTAKGALMVRLQHPGSNQVLDFVTAHLQADDDQAAIRDTQMAQIRGRCQAGVRSAPNLMTSSLGLPLDPGTGICAWPNTEWLALAGDHNIRGEGAVAASVHPGTAATVSGPSEWNTQVGTDSRAFATNGWSLYDPWAETTAPLDRGLTNEHDSARLDYILTSRRTQPLAPFEPPVPDLCVQHVWNPPELASISDHNPVAADLNLAAPQCNPRLAYPVGPGDLAIAGQTKAGRRLDRAITFPGSMQWFRIDQPGTYTFAATDAAGPLASEVFADDNLSVPLGGAHRLGEDRIQSCGASVTGAMQCVPVFGEKLVVPHAPFFVRVWSPDRAFEGAYAFTAYRYTCKSPGEACAVLPNAPQDFAFPPAGTALGTEDAAWFEINLVDQADSGAAQTLRFHADALRLGTFSAPSIKIIDAAGANELTAIDGAPIGDLALDTAPSGRPRVSRMASATTNQRVLMRVGRRRINQNLAVTVGWQTDLVLVGALIPSATELVCDDETNPEWGVDEIRMRTRVDGAWRDAGFSTFDCDDNAHHRGWGAQLGVIRALEGVGIRVLEEDAFLSGGDDESGVAEVNLIPMDRVVRAVEHHRLNWSFSGGEYHLAFDVGKWMP